MSNQDHRSLVDTYASGDSPECAAACLIDRRRSVRIPTDQCAEIRRVNPLKDGVLQGHLLDASREGVRLRTPAFLRPASSIEVRFAGSIVLGEVRYCRRNGPEFEAGIQIQDTFPAPYRQGQFSRRSEPRNPVNVGALLRLEARREQLFSVTILDVSQKGLRVRCSSAPPQLTRVEVTWDDVVAAGTVRYAREVTSGGYNIGISVDSVTAGDTRSDGEELDLTMLLDLA
jgi:hypothetical protein